MQSVCHWVRYDFLRMAIVAACLLSVRRTVRYPECMMEQDSQSPAERETSTVVLPPDDKHASGRASAAIAWVWMRDIVVSVVVAVFIITFLYQPVRVEGTSMLPRLENHDRLFINKFVYRFEAIQRGDVIVFHYPRDPRLSYIKRVIAVPGDRVEIDRGQVVVNGNPLSEPYVPLQYRDMRSMEPEVVPPGEYFVLGDHRSIASDSRDFGMVARPLIYGKAEFVYWPSRDAGFVR